ncbi:pyridoxamine 5'-phosphate oxidase family protein [Austwickia chelonae]|uniref:pyridoxamine 5'-phosphate oxidase family protein n=1 Tax=Austwickia chelonae TaxID=100225 RepID=UPI000E23072B|nr:pyridoxamine 5'-phosphate oxidase family protein [Austwickia chelonae]
MTPSADNGPEGARPGTALDEETCLGILRGLEFGRLAYLVNGRVELVPVNYAIHRDEIVFRTAEGSKLAGALAGDEVVFEVDEITEEKATSVIVRAIPRALSHEEARWSDQMRLRPWVVSEKDHVIGLAPTLISGRAFNLARPWRSLRPHP